MDIPFTQDGWLAVLAGTALLTSLWVGHDLLRDRFFKHETSTAYGTASWASRRYLKRKGLLGRDGIILGRSGRKLIRQQSNKHLLTLAPNRAGKGVSAIIPNLLTWEGSALVIDPKGENAIVTAARRKAMGQNVYVLDPWGITGLARSRFNPLLTLSENCADISEDAALLADALVTSSSKGEEKFWTNEAKALIAGILMHVATTEMPEDRHLGTFRHALTSGEAALEDFLEDMRENKSAFGLVSRSAERLLQKTDKERSGVISTAQAHTHFLDSPRMTQVSCASDFDLTDLKKGNTTIYLVLPAERLVTHGRWLRLVVSLCLASLTNDRSIPSKPVLFLLDEFAALGRLQSVETAMGLLAGYGVLLWPILQDLSQLQDLYPNRWRSFLANAGAIQAFGANDLGTAKYISGMLGERTATVRQHSRSGQDKFTSGSESYHGISRSLLLPQEIMRLSGNKEILLMQGMKPTLASRVLYYEDKEFQGLYGQNPMFKG